MSTGFTPPEKGTEAYDAWLDGPRPDAGNGRGQWLRARQLRGKDEERAAAEAAAEAEALRPKAQSRMAAGSEEPERHADDLRALQHIIDTAPILSDRTRAIEAKQRILAKVEAEEREREHGPLIDLRAALEALPSGDRVDALSQLLRVE